MDRRAWGAVLVVVVIIAALTVPNLAGRRVEGTASRVPVADPPRVGDCLLDDPTRTRSVLDYTSVEIYAAQTGPCGQENYGEVVSVTMDARSFPVTVANRLSHPEPMACNPLVRAYFGWPDGDIGRSDGGTADAWRPVATASIGLIGPNLWQYLGRQDWLACVVYPRDAPYAGLIGRSFEDRTAADAYALCLSDPQFDTESESPQSVSCSVPHRTEVLGWATVTDSASAAAALTDTCGQFAARITALPDPTAGGRLNVAAIALHDDGQGRWSADPAGVGAAGQIACTLSAVGADRLAATLTGIADGALPWA